MVGVNSGGSIYYRAGITEDNPIGTDWVNIPGGLKQIDTYRGDVWGVNVHNGVFHLDIIC